MNSLEEKICRLLEDLKEHYYISGVKAEFGAEGTGMEEALKLREFALNFDLDFILKIGGCEAVRDMYDAKSIGVNALVSPMIETSYALKKYINSIKDVFSEEKQNQINFFINIETYTGYINLKSITETAGFDMLKGIVLGRSDMAGSMDLPKSEINSDKMLNIAQTMSLKMKELNKDMIIGGGISAKSVPFLKKVPHLSSFETRKIIFNTSVLLNTAHAEEGVLKAIDFERLWIMNRRENYGITKNNDYERLRILEKLLNESVKI